MTVDYCHVEFDTAPNCQKRRFNCFNGVPCRCGGLVIHTNKQIWDTTEKLKRWIVVVQDEYTNNRI